MEKVGKFGGRPQRKPKPGERVHLGFRTTPEMKGAIARAADKSGRSISQEAEYRLERTFLKQESIKDALDFAYGKETAALLLALGQLVSETTHVISIGSIGSRWSRSDWINDPQVYDEIHRAIFTFLMMLRPSKENLHPISANKGYGASHAVDMLQSIAALPRNATPVWAAEIRQRFGEDVAARIQSRMDPSLIADEAKIISSNTQTEAAVGSPEEVAAQILSKIAPATKRRDKKK